MSEGTQDRTQSRHPLSRHKQVLKSSTILIITGAICIIVACEAHGDLSRLLAVYGQYLPLIWAGVLLGWLIGSFLVLAFSGDRIIITDPETGRDYVLHSTGSRFLGAGTRKHEMIEWENRCIDVINSTSIPDMIPDGDCVQVECLYAGDDTVELVVSYPVEYDISAQLEEVFAPVRSRMMLAPSEDDGSDGDDGTVHVLYVIDDPRSVKFVSHLKRG